MIAVIKYNAGNIRSVAFALERMSVDFIVTSDPEEIRKADKVLFPGVGEARSTMKFLQATGLDQVIRNLTQPTLGICLGMQLMCQHSEENDTPCLGIFEESVVRFPTLPGLKIPHMGWNTLTLKEPWIDQTADQQDVYFVHSYYVPVNQHTSATAFHGVTFSAAMHRDNFYAVQFHPEKSGETGLHILESFLRLPI